MRTIKNPGEKRRPSRYGFATFFRDGKYYFQLNDEEGQPAFYGHGYQSEKGRDNGIRAVIRNAKDNANFDVEQTEDGLHYFILKSGNNQEIGSSPLFDTEAEMEEKRRLLEATEERIPVFARGEEGDAAPVAPQLREEPQVSPPEAGGNKPLEKPGKRPPHAFSITCDPASATWLIKHEASGDRKKLPSCQGSAIEAFLREHLPAEKEGERTGSAAPKGVPAKSEETVEGAIDFQVRSFEGDLVERLARTGELKWIEIRSERGTSSPSKPFTAKVVAKSLAGNESVTLSDLKELRPISGWFLVPIFEANQLEPGTYRFTVDIYQDAKGEGDVEYHGSRTIMLN